MRLSSVSKLGSSYGVVFLTSKFNKVKNGKDPDGGELKVVFEGEEKAYLQRMAWEAVQEFGEMKKE